MLKKIASVSDIQAIEPGDYIFDKPDELSSRHYEVYKTIIDDLLIKYKEGIIQTKLLTKKDLLSGNWWVDE